MSYYVIKGPRDADNYLTWRPGFSCPQWWYKREEAKRFPDSESAWKYLALIQEKHGGEYVARVVRVSTTRDRRAEIAQLRAEVERLRSNPNRAYQDGWNDMLKRAVDVADNAENECANEAEKTGAARVYNDLFQLLEESQMPCKPEGGG